MIWGEIPDEGTIQQLLTEFGQTAQVICDACGEIVFLRWWRMHKQDHLRDALAYERACQQATAEAVERWLFRERWGIWS